MNYKKALKLSENAEYKYRVKNSVFKGLSILSKYCDDLYISAEHDVIFVSDREDEALVDKMSETDVKKMLEYNWFLDEDYGSWSINV